MPLGLSLLALALHFKGVIIVIAHHGQGACLPHEMHHPARVRPLGDQITRQHHALAPDHAAFAQESLELIQAAVNVSNDEGSFHETL